MPGWRRGRPWASRLARHVSAALDRWDVVADDSAGLPLQLSPPGRFLRQVAQLMTRPLTTSRLLSLLQHPLCHAGAARTTHLRHSRTLELWLRKESHSLWMPWPLRSCCGACCLLGLVLRGISFRGEQWRLATLGPVAG